MIKIGECTPLGVVFFVFIHEQQDKKLFPFCLQSVKELDYLKTTPETDQDLIKFGYVRLMKIGGGRSANTYLLVDKKPQHSV